MYAELLALDVLNDKPVDEMAKPSPRMRIISVYDSNQDAPIYCRARITQTLRVHRNCLCNLSPDKSISLRSSQDVVGLRGKSEREVCDWLAARYNRGWAPSEFDRRLKKSVGKIQPSLTRLRGLGVEEIFIRVTPAEELPDNEYYEVTIVILIDPEYQQNKGAIESEARSLAGVVQQPNKVKLVTPPHVVLSIDYGYGYLKGMLRFADVFRDALAAQNVAVGSRK